VIDPRETIRTKRDGGRCDPEHLEAFVAGVADGSVPDIQAVALLMAIFQHGLEGEELFAWTRAMLDSGGKLGRGAGPVRLDKHSTGGVGDKVSLVLAPALAACGVRVPMISGRGLGHTGGTLDKMESIAGLRTVLDEPSIDRAIDQAGWVIAAQTATLVPADRKLYALRDGTSTVESIPLIASSILSKKLAEGLDGFVLDIKVGSGGFLKDIAMGRELGRTILGLCSRFGLRASAQLTAMDRPIGVAIGNANEVRESIDSLRGEGPEDLWELTRELGADLLVQGGIAPNPLTARARLDAVRADGSAFEAFVRGVVAQGGDASVVEDPTRMPSAPDVEDFVAPASGPLTVVDCRRIGLAAMALGAGRRLPGDDVDMGVGLEWLAIPGAEVRAGETLAQLHHRGGHGLEEARGHLLASMTFDGDGEHLPALIERLSDVD
jgi:pyrimidine-nucleoside phosphorylase